MINITFYTFSKKENSTARPSGSGTVYKCAVKTGCSILSPIVELSGETFAGKQSPQYNYAYVKDWDNRYYFVTNITYERGLWIISMAEDVLASYRTTIGNSRMYITRSSARQNVYLKDSAYPLTGESDIVTDIFEYGNLTAYSSGTFVVNVLSQAANAGLGTYLFSFAQFVQFCAALQSDMADTSVSVWDALAQNIKVTTYEPLRYIGSVLWFPPGYTLPAGTEISTLYLGNYEATGFTCHRLNVATSPSRHEYHLTIPKHPQTGSRGNWVNLAPATEYQLQLPPFGTIQLDTSAMLDASTVDIWIRADPITGMSRCIITTDTGASLADVAAQYGVPIRIAALVDGSFMAGVGAAISAGTAAFSAYTGDVKDAVKGVVQSVQGIGDAIKGSVNTFGSTGSVIDHQTDKVLYSRFFYFAPDDNANKGRPYCAMATPAELGGYMEVLNSTIQFARATKPELTAVNDYLERGFYFE